MTYIETWEQFWRDLHRIAQRTVTAHSGTRKGQAYFNALVLVRPDFADNIRGTNEDPYYNDDKLPMFFNAVERYLEAD